MNVCTICALENHLCYNGSTKCGSLTYCCNFCDALVCTAHICVDVYHKLKVCNKCIGKENIVAIRRGIFEAADCVIPSVAYFYKEVYNASKTKKCK